jgi:hypothetical protein
MTVDNGFRIVASQELKVTSPRRVLYPETGTSKAQVLDLLGSPDYPSLVG